MSAVGVPLGDPHPVTAIDKSSAARRPCARLSYAPPWQTAGPGSLRAVALVEVGGSDFDGGEGRAIDVLLAWGRSRDRVYRVSRANADDRLPPKPLGGVEGGD